MRIPRVIMILLTSLFFSVVGMGQDGGNNSDKPNIIVIFCDDLGYGDLSSYGSTWNQTPEIDQMATEGVRFTNFYAGAPFCTPSRAGLLTGSYPRRVDMDQVLFPSAKKGINPDEEILPEVLKKAGYATAIVGKWHLGDQPVFLPTRHGFDYWYGLPYSNNMEHGKHPSLPVMKNEKVFEQDAERGTFDQSTLTKKYTEETISWMDKNKNKPFFLYLAHTMPHNPVAARKEFFGKTDNPKKGFGASVAEISWSTGKILDYLRKNKLDENTLVIFTSDNGGNPRWGASNGILKGKKGQIAEGGIRVPFIAWWPGRINPGTTCHAPASVIDFYETFSALAGVEIDSAVKRDGKDIFDYLVNPQKKREARPFYYWHGGSLRAIRYGNWKIMLTGPFTQETQIVLYDLHTDPGEHINVAEEHPEVITKLLAWAYREKKALGERKDYGPEVRRTILVDNPKPLIKQMR